MDKTQLRHHAKTIRDAISDAQRQLDSKAIYKRIGSSLHQSNGGANLTIGTYFPIGSEIIPPHKIEGYQMALPVVRHQTTLEFYKWREGDSLVKKDFDIPIPDTRGITPVLPNILFVPLLLCDENGGRIGYGAGHYDRYIASCKTKPFLIGVCFDEQIWHDSLPVEPHDQPLDLIVTPKRVIEIL